MSQSANVVARFIPPHVQTKIQDRLVDMLAEAFSSESWRKLIHSYRSDAEFQESLVRAIEKAVRHFSLEYEDKQLVDALTKNTSFWDLTSVQKALKEVIMRPSSYLDAEYAALLHSFTDVLPTIPLESVEHCMGFFLQCVADEVITIPKLAPIYQVQLHRASLNQARQMVHALHELRQDQREWMTILIENFTQYPSTPSLLAGQKPVPVILNSPHNLPPQMGEFLGREKDIAYVLDGLRSRWPIVSIEGMGGIGKTTLALQIAARYCLPGSEARLDPPFEHIVWVSAGDAPERKFWLNEVLDAIGRVLGFFTINKMLQEQKQVEIDLLLRDHRTLIILDDLETIQESAGQ